MITIRPKSPIAQVTIGLLFLIASITGLFFGSDTILVKMISLLLFGFAFLLFYFTDFDFIKITLDERKVILKGFFYLRKEEIALESINGYEVQERVDRINGVHEVVTLVTSKKKIIFPRSSYTNYNDVESFCKENFVYLGKKKFKHANLYSKWMPIVYLLSGIFALLVGLLKILK